MLLAVALSVVVLVPGELPRDCLTVLFSFDSFFVVLVLFLFRFKRGRFSGVPRVVR